MKCLLNRHSSFFYVLESIIFLVLRAIGKLKMHLHKSPNRGTAWGSDHVTFKGKALCVLPPTKTSRLWIQPYH